MWRALGTYVLTEEPESQTSRSGQLSVVFPYRLLLWNPNPGGVGDVPPSRLPPIAQCALPSHCDQPIGSIPDSLPLSEDVDSGAGLGGLQKNSSPFLGLWLLLLRRYLTL